MHYAHTHYCTFCVLCVLLCHACTHCCACMCVVTSFYVVYECMRKHAFIHVFVPECFVCPCVSCFVGLRQSTSTWCPMETAYPMLANRLTGQLRSHMALLIRAQHNITGQSLLGKASTLSMLQCITHSPFPTIHAE